MSGKKFILCGLTGWCIEIAFTSFVSALRKDKKLMGRTSAWMFPIYGLACTIEMIYPKICHWSAFCRGLLYGATIMGTEYLTGRLLSLFDMCPWCYKHARFSIHGVIRLDYFPLWMLTGLFYEWLLRAKNVDFRRNKAHTIR